GEKRRSKPMEALICSITAAGPAANRPPHMRFALPAAADAVNPSSRMLPAGGGDGGGLMLKRVVPGLVGAALAAAVGWLGLQYWGAGTPPWADPAGQSAVPPISGTVGNFTP